MYTSSKKLRSTFSLTSSFTIKCFAGNCGIVLFFKKKKKRPTKKKVFSNAARILEEWDRMTLSVAGNMNQCGHRYFYHNYSCADGP